MIILIWHVTKYKVHKLQQRHIVVCHKELIRMLKVSVCSCLLSTRKKRIPNPIICHTHLQTHTQFTYVHIHTCTDSATQMQTQACTHLVLNTDFPQADVFPVESELVDQELVDLLHGVFPTEGGSVGQVPPGGVGAVG